LINFLGGSIYSEAARREACLLVMDKSERYYGCCCWLLLT